MRRKRAKVDGSAYYHVMSRCALQQYLLKGNGIEKEMFVKMLRRAEFFSGIKVMNYCVMDNHFHLLIHVPQREEVDNEELLRRIGVLYGAAKAKKIAEHWQCFENDGRKDIVEKERAAYKRRMYDISEFMKTFKQRYALWFSSNHGGIEGTIWQGPFHSVLIDGGGDALGVISAYITLNPVRAHMVENPSEYEWSGYGAASRGDIFAKKALLEYYGDKIPIAKRWNAYKSMLKIAMEETGAEIKMEVSEEQSEPKVDKQEEEKDETSINLESKVIEALPESALRFRNKDISRGVAFGRKDFVLAAIVKASNAEKILTYAKAYCMVSNAKLYCAGRRCE